MPDGAIDDSSHALSYQQRKGLEPPLWGSSWDEGQCLKLEICTIRIFGTTQKTPTQSRVGDQVTGEKTLSPQRPCGPCSLRPHPVPQGSLSPETPAAQATPASVLCWWACLCAEGMMGRVWEEPRGCSLWELDSRWCSGFCWGEKRLFEVVLLESRPGGQLRDGPTWPPARQPALCF